MRRNRKTSGQTGAQSAGSALFGLPLDSQIERLCAMCGEELRQSWRDVFDRPPPKHLSRGLLQHALAYHLQEQREGGLSKAALKLLAQPVASIDGAPQTQGSLITAPRPGTRLVREWHGETHVVTVLDRGFEYNGAPYRSLSQIARTITGTRWSGPLFFGLRKRPPHPDGAES